MVTEETIRSSDVLDKRKPLRRLEADSVDEAEGCEVLAHDDCFDPLDAQPLKIDEQLPQLRVPDAAVGVVRIDPDGVKDGDRFRPPASSFRACGELTKVKSGAGPWC